MGRFFVEYVDDTKLSKCKYVCSCGIDVATDQAMLWEGYMQFDQPAFLFKQTVNVDPYSIAREETLSSGKYEIQDVKCRVCCTKLGWKYLRSEKTDQKYKEACLLLQQSALKKVDKDRHPIGPPERLFA